MMLQQLLRNTQRRFFQKIEPLVKNCKRFQSSEAQDILLYSSDRPYVSRLIALLGVSQFGALCYISNNVYHTLPAFSSWIPRDDPNDTRDINWKEDRLPLAKESTRRNYAIFCVYMSAMLGYFMLRMSSRTVHSLTMLKSGRNVRLQTIRPFLPGMKDIVLPVNSLSAQRRSGSHVIVRVKDKYFFKYYIDRTGEFHNPELFNNAIQYRGF